MEATELDHRLQGVKQLERLVVCDGHGVHVDLARLAVEVQILHDARVRVVLHVRPVVAHSVHGQRQQAGVRVQTVRNLVQAQRPALALYTQRLQRGIGLQLGAQRVDLLGLPGADQTQLPQQVQVGVHKRHPLRLEDRLLVPLAELLEMQLALGLVVEQLGQVVVLDITLVQMQTPEVAAKYEFQQVCARLHTQLGQVQLEPGDGRLTEDSQDGLH
mmetsp:Transcript_3411/g.6884  ORF Transcript_3411/g.6884 Transcript_3411/m.6884 type:complete len:216 (-) Transcript_3411:313-960(-)